MSPALQGLITIFIGVGGCLAYFYGSNIFLDKVLFPAKGADAGRNINRANMVRPWLFLMPALLALGLYLAYPVVETFRLSLSERLPGGASQYVGFDNYRRMFAEDKFWEAMRNNLLWLLIVPAAATALGLLVAQLTDRIKWGSFAKSLIFMPMAISFVGAAVIFKLIYDARPADQNQIGILNALWLQFDGGFGSILILRVVPALMFAGFAAVVGYAAYLVGRPIVKPASHVVEGIAFKLLRVVGAVLLAWVAVLSALNVIDSVTLAMPYGEQQTWLTIPFWNNFFLMVVLIWIQTGFAMVILSAALRGIPEDTIEAAIIDGANPFQIFFKIKVPQIMNTIVVVWTTITIVVLKVFDIVFAMTNGQWETQVLANYMYDKLFRSNDWGVGSASAMIIMLLVTPILVWNVYNARKEMR
ncbi:MAG: sugar ABC transporter permease [Marivivens sp.]|jgi:alpha-glucoside transport system permease protein|uniref:carbohydrate ABC transporter permease n=1 Tax=Marivivens sp. TaxID=1978374 RepID=UPI00179C77F1|nr:sugar ABC transporter permease [Marivivens sp.]MCL7405859.1 sugar ABC transporter permease [Marivivens geojensis]NBQ50713.1 sugar ABC transporter permease [Marivivens sp.]NBT52642.1 sugar ABC transporter permease [Marivivens sp.]NBX09490.1 sugar ABC transporter permease [Marivivens sp.]NCW69043.1 sugar ABC transporter permease [Marivivens sp.]